MIGTPHKATVRVRRFGDAPQPVEVRFVGGPAGLLAPVAATIPADTDQIELELLATAQATAGEYDTLRVTAETTSVDQPVVAMSPVTRITIASPP